jgi:predicted ribonuclease toxin of YeeF-YezG toxin-antitoxin module
MEERDKAEKKAKKVLKQLDKLVEEYKALPSEVKKSLPEHLRRFMGDTTNGK